MLIGAGIVALLAGSRTVFWILFLSLIATVIGQTARRPQQGCGDENVCRFDSGSDVAALPVEMGDRPVAVAVGDECVAAGEDHYKHFPDSL